MKKIPTISCAIIVFLILGCSSAKNYSSTSFSTGFLKNKTVVFTLTEKSERERIVVDGPFIGSINTAQNNKALFIRSISELAAETQIHLKFNDVEEKPSDSVICIEADLKLIQLNIGFSAFSTETYMRYTIKNGNQVIPITGKFRKGGGGSETMMLRNSLKNANYLLLKEIEKSKKY